MPRAIPRRRCTWALPTAVACALTAAGSAAAGEPSPGSATTAHDAPAPHGSVYVDPLGFLLFGPTIGVEVGAGHVTGLLDARWFSMGVLAHSLFLNQGDSFDFSWGVGGAGRYYLWTGMAGPYVGARFEYLASRIENDGELIVTNSSYAVPQLEGGYRLALGTTFYAGGTAAIGYAFRLTGTVDNLPGGTNASLYTASDRSSFYGSASLELGVFF